MDIYDEWSKESLLALADEAKKKIAAKRAGLDGEVCIRCTNFSRFATKNFDSIFLCYSCNTYRNRVILGLE